MVDEENIFHVYPRGDTEDHILTVKQSVIGVDMYMVMIYSMMCECKCNPRIERQKNGAVIVVHNSFDGREGVEWANEILKGEGHHE